MSAIGVCFSVFLFLVFLFPSTGVLDGPPSSLREYVAAASPILSPFAQLARGQRTRARSCVRTVLVVGHVASAAARAAPSGDVRRCGGIHGCAGACLVAADVAAGTCCRGVEEVSGA